MFFAMQKFEKRIAELEGLRYRDAKTIGPYIAVEDPEGVIGAKPYENPSKVNGAGKMHIGDIWKGRDRYIWLTVQADIPMEWRGKQVLGRFDFGTTEGGNNGGFESLCYVNGIAYQGVDSNHMEVFLPKEVAGHTVRLDFRLWSGLEGGGKPRELTHTIRMSELCWLDEPADDLYYTSRAALEAMQCLGDKQPERLLLTQALDRSLFLIDWSDPGSDMFYASLHEALHKLNGELADVKPRHPVTVTCIGHTHIDVAWLWRLKHTREKSARSFSTVLRLMEKFPDYTFLQTQPQLYDYMKQDYPELYKQIKERIAEGRWEAGGGMWVEADCNLTSGESLVRQLLFGTRFFREEFGVESRYLWLPDVFGYSWALPQILKKSGFDTFMTTKISWNQFNPMPHDTFQWRGMDGTEVLTHFITTPDDWEEANSYFYTYNGLVEAKTVKGTWEAYRDLEVNQELLLSYGYGDGGGGVNREMLEQRRRLDRMPGMPNVQTGRADTYFERLGRTFEQTDRYVHTWDGELYLEYHRGTYTSQAYNKRMNRKLELLYRETEWLAVLAGVQVKNWQTYDQNMLNEGWKILLRNQFHDIIPGSSIREVYEDSTVEYAEAEAIARKVWSRQMNVLRHGADCSEDVNCSNEDPDDKVDEKYSEMADRDSHDSSGIITVVNSSSWALNEPVRIAATVLPGQVSWTTLEGAVLPSQRLEREWLVGAVEVPALGMAAICYRAVDTTAVSANAVFQYEQGRLLTPHYEIRWNVEGQLTQIRDLLVQREVLAPGSRGNVLQVFEDKPMNFDAWDIDIFYQEKMHEVKQLLSVKLLHSGDVAATVEFRWIYGKSSFTQRMTVYAEGRRIDFQTEVDWQERQKLLKVAFPVQIRSTEATYDIQFGNVKRATHWNTSWDYARFEVVGHQWADLSERGYGVSLLNDCKYGYDIKDHVMRLSLLKSANYPNETADQGYHLFTYALLPHAGDWYEARTVQEAWALNNPPASLEGRVMGGKAVSFLRTDADHVMVDAVKKAEDNHTVIVRLHEYAGIRTRVTLESDYEILSWAMCDMMENREGEMQSLPLVIDVLPYEVITLQLKLF